MEKKYQAGEDIKVGDLVYLKNGLLFKEKKVRKTAKTKKVKRI